MTARKQPARRKGGTKQSGVVSDINQRRRNSTPNALRRKRELGNDHGSERALLRIGPSSTKVLTGADDLSEWDDEELRRGKRRVQQGRFAGRFMGKDPVVVPKALHDELVKRTLAEATKLFYENVVEAVQILVDLIRDEDVEPKDKLRAIAMITDRAMGKAPEKVEISGEMAPWEIALRGGIVNSGGSTEPEDD